jgi:hypothetical protein
MLNITQLRELIAKHNKLSKITIPPKSTKAQLIKLIEGQGYKVFEDQGKIVGGPKRIIKPTPAKKPAPAKKATPKKTKKVDFDDLYGGGSGPLGGYINDWADGSDEAKAQGFTFAKVRDAIKRMLKDYNTIDNPTIQGAASFIRNMSEKEQNKYMKAAPAKKADGRKT